MTFLTSDVPLFHLDTVVKPEWIDEYGHLNMAYYVLICDFATAAFWDRMNEPVTLEERDGAEYAVVETHVNYMDELRAHAPLVVTTQAPGCRCQAVSHLPQPQSRRRGLPCGHQRGHGARLQTSTPAR